jgi:hypothetical protein
MDDAPYPFDLSCLLVVVGFGLLWLGAVWLVT